MSFIAKRTAFTMIEMIFVIVILGILAGVAMTTLAATRDDAKGSRAAMNLATAIQDIGSHYTATGTLDVGATNAVVAGDCFVLVAADSDGDGVDDGITVTSSIGDGAHCASAIGIAAMNQLVGTRVFKETKVAY
ncbi:type II secretion system protein [Sulfurimonas sp. HSL3-7]|uniref:type II secretion system protein n=1 Tax=Sulfonitrofixus jiaomeiensis TaxID=3131938 RepID=UPI0031F7DD90